MIGFQSKDPQTLSRQLKTESLVIKYADFFLYSANAAVVTIPIGDYVGQVLTAVHFDASLNGAAGGLVGVLDANMVPTDIVTGDQASIVITLANALAAGYSLTVQWIAGDKPVLS